MLLKSYQLSEEPYCRYIRLLLLKNTQPVDAIEKALSIGEINEQLVKADIALLGGDFAKAGELYKTLYAANITNEVKLDVLCGLLLGKW